MISRVAQDDESPEEFRAVCQQDWVLGAEVATLLAVYGPVSYFADFWLAREPNGIARAALCRENGRLLIAGGGISRELAGEISEFAGMAGGWSLLRAEADLCAAVSADRSIFTSPAMEYPGGFMPAELGYIQEHPPLGPLYELICESFGASGSGRDRWYAFTSHLFRHDLGFAAVMEEDGQPVCTGGVYAWGPQQGVLATIATHTSYRRRGYGEQMVRYLTNRVLARGKRPTLLCANEGLARYYEKLGYRSFARWGELQI